MRGARLFLTFALLLATGVAASAYSLLGSKWKNKTVVMHLELGSAGTLIDGSPTWDTVAVGALSIWNTFVQNVQFSPVTDSLKAGDYNGVNNVFFSNTIYGQDFGDAVAVTTEWNTPADKTAKRESDVIFNGNLAWNSYRGALRHDGSGQILYDLRRVALHEFGHVLGLDHPDEVGQTVKALMNSRVSGLDMLQSDDVLGAQSLYGAGPGVLEEEPLATIARPLGNSVTTGRSKFSFSGSADTSVVDFVLLANSKLGARKYFETRGVQSWKATLALKRGRNVIRLYVVDRDGVRKNVAQRIVFKH